MCEQKEGSRALVSQWPPWLLAPWPAGLQDTLFSSVKVYVGVKQEIAEMRIPALNAYMKVPQATPPLRSGGTGGWAWVLPRVWLWEQAPT